MGSKQFFPYSSVEIFVSAQDICQHKAKSMGLAHMEPRGVSEHASSITVKSFPEVALVKARDGNVQRALPLRRLLPLNQNGALIRALHQGTSAV